MNTHTGEWKSSPPATAVEALRWIERDCAEVVRQAGMGEDLPPVEDLARRYQFALNIGAAARKGLGAESEWEPTRGAES